MAVEPTALSTRILLLLVWVHHDLSFLVTLCGSITILYVDCVERPRGEDQYHMNQQEEESIRAEVLSLVRGEKPEPQRLIALLQRVQRHFGYLPRTAMIELAQFLHISPARVYGVASFYNQFRFSPPGKYPIKVCLGTACHIKGGEAVLKVWENKLGISEGQTTPDRLCSLDRVACIGCCALAPVNVVGDRIEPCVTPIRVEGLLLAMGVSPQRSTPEERAHASADREG